MFTKDIKITVFILLVGLFIIIFLSSIQVVVAADGINEQIIFTEIMYDLDGGDDKQEWVEIYNNSNQGLEINSDWRFFDGSNHLLTVIQGDQILDSGEVAVIVDSAEDFLISHPEFTGMLIDSVVKLSNTGEEIKLSLDNGETWIAQVGYTSELGANGDGYSLEYQEGNWIPSLELNGNPGIYLVDESDDSLCCCDVCELVYTDDDVSNIDLDTDNEIDDDINNIDNLDNNVGDSVADDTSGELDNTNNLGNGSSYSNYEEQVIYSNKVFINELVPDPEGDDERGEYIELFNSDSIEVDLNNWWLEDDGGKKYVLSNTISANEYLVIHRVDSKITLNNSSGDVVKLFNPNKDVVSEVQYDKSVASQSYSFFVDYWQWTENLTPGIENVMPIEIVEEIGKIIEEEVINKNHDQVDELEVIELELQLISNIKDLELNSEVYTQGVVTVLPGHFAQTYFYISEIDFDGDVNLGVGIQIYSSKKDFPEMSVGDMLVVLGKLSETSGEKRIKISTHDDIRVLSSITLPDANELLTGEINDDYEGGLIKVIGDLVDKKSTSWYLDDNSGEIRVYINSKTGMTKPNVKLGQKVGVIGIVSETKSGFRLLPRFDEDISVEETIIEQTEPEVTVISTRNKQLIDIVDNNKNSSENYLGYGLGVVGLTILSWVVKIKFF